MNIKPLSYYQTNTEWQVFDRKSVRIACKDFAELIVAFANADGGEVVIGIEDDGTITGVDRMFREMQEAGSPEPVFEQLGFMVKASIFQHQSFAKVQPQEANVSQTTESSQEVHGKFIENLQKKDREVVEIIVNNPSATQNEMSVILNITSRAVAKRLKSMQERGIVKRIGPDKGGHWEVCTEERKNLT